MSADSPSTFPVPDMLGALETRIASRESVDPHKRSEVLSAIEQLRARGASPRTLNECLRVIEETNPEAGRLVRTRFVADLSVALASEQPKIATETAREKTTRISADLEQSFVTDLLARCSVGPEYSSEFLALYSQAGLTEHELTLLQGNVMRAFQGVQKNARGVETGGMGMLSSEELAVARKVQPIIDRMQEIVQIDPLQKQLFQSLSQDLELSDRAQENIRKRFGLDERADRAHFEAFYKFFEDAVWIKNACDMASGSGDVTNQDVEWRKQATKLLRTNGSLFSALNTLKATGEPPTQQEITLTKTWMDEKNAVVHQQAIEHMLSDALQRMVPGVNLAKDGFFTADGQLNLSALSADTINTLSLLALCITGGLSEWAVLAAKLGQMGVRGEKILMTLKTIVRADALVTTGGAIYGGAEATSALLQGEYGAASLGIAMSVMGGFWAAGSLRAIRQTDHLKMKWRVERAESHRHGISHTEALANSKLLDHLEPGKGNGAEAARLLEDFLKSKGLPNRTFTPEQGETALRIHHEMSRWVYKNDTQTLRRMMEEAQGVGFTKEEREIFTRNGVWGKAEPRPTQDLAVEWRTTTGSQKAGEGSLARASERTEWGEAHTVLPEIRLYRQSIEGLRKELAPSILSIRTFAEKFKRYAHEESFGKRSHEMNNNMLYTEFDAFNNSIDELANKIYLFRKLEKWDATLRETQKFQDLQETLRQWLRLISEPLTDVTNGLGKARRELSTFREGAVLWDKNRTTVSEFVDKLEFIRWFMNGKG